MAQRAKPKPQMQPKQNTCQIAAMPQSTLKHKISSEPRLLSVLENLSHCTLKKGSLKFQGLAEEPIGNSKCLSVVVGAQHFLQLNYSQLVRQLPERATRIYQTA